jgi:hypothetical protein
MEHHRWRTPPAERSEPVPTRGGDLTAFLCHSSQDKERVRDLHRRLTEDGISCWFDEEDLRPGQDWDHEIGRALGRSRYVLACLSRGSITKAGYVQRELHRALDRADEQPEGSIYLIPVRLEPCEIPERLKRWQWVDLFEPQGYQRLVAALEDDPGAALDDRAGRATDQRPAGGNQLASAPAGGVQTATRGTPAKLGLAAGIAAALVVVLVVALIAWQKRDLGTGLDPVGSRPAPTSVPTPSAQPTQPAGASDGFELFDDFSGNTLDPARWVGAEAAASIVSVTGGVLRVEAPAGKGEGAGAEVQAVLPRGVAAIRFGMTVRRVDGRNDGGAHARLVGASGRFHEIWGGPDGSGVPTLGYAICTADTTCSSYNEFAERAEQAAPLGRPFVVDVRRTDGGWQIDLDGRQWTKVAAERGPIEGLKIGAYTFGEGFQVDFDDIRVAHE